MHMNLLPVVAERALADAALEPFPFVVLFGIPQMDDHHDLIIIGLSGPGAHTIKSLMIRLLYSYICQLVAGIRALPRLRGAAIINGRSRGWQALRAIYSCAHAGFEFAC